MPTVLVLDDIPEAVKLFEIILKQFGFQVVSGRDGNEGLHLLETANPPPSLIICDLRMPYMDGLTFLQQVRQHPQWQSIPFVLTTPPTLLDSIRLASEYDIDGFLPKPFALAQLKSLLTKLGVLAGAG